MHVGDVRAGDLVILTKGLGVGVLFAGLMQGKAQGAHVSAALAKMLHSNRQAAELLRSHGSIAMTDVTGFGLIGHLQRLLQGLRFAGSKVVDNNLVDNNVVDSGIADGGSADSEFADDRLADGELADDRFADGEFADGGRRQASITVGVDLWQSAIPLLDGALSLSRIGCRSSLWPQNRLPLSNAMIESGVEVAAYDLLADPQTNGGLLAILPEAQAEACLDSLVSAGYQDASIIGVVRSDSSVHIKNTKP